MEADLANVGPVVHVARCSYCDHEHPASALMPSAVGGAVCKDWFACQVRHDNIGIVPRRPPPRPTHA